jgi:hypothetical protein
MSKVKSKEITKGIMRSGDSNEYGVRLRVGDIVDLNGRGSEHFVWFVNDSRAAVIPLGERKEFNFKTLEGKSVHFEADPASVNISPNSEIPILRRLGRDGLIEYLAKRNAERKAVMADKEKTKTKSKGEEGPKLGHLGGFLGHPVTGVIRAMGVAGWSFKEVRYVFDKAKIEVADNTIRIQLHKGKSGAQEPAAVSKKELAQLRDTVPAEVTETKKADKKAKGKAAKNGKPAKAAKPAEVEDDGDDDEGEDEPAPVKPKAKVKTKPSKPAKEEEAEEATEEEAEEVEV